MFLWVMDRCPFGNGTYLSDWAFALMQAAELRLLSAIVESEVRTLRGVSMD